MKSQFQFIHIPKTAGKTFALMLTKQFLFKKKLGIFGEPKRIEYYKLSNEVKSKYKLIFGHLPLVLNPLVNITSFTFLRKPDDRIMSLYKFIKGDSIHDIKKKIDVEKYQLKDFLKEGIVKNFDNAQVRFIAGREYKPFGTINQEDLDLAIKNLDHHYTLFGLTEYFDESICILYKLMNWGIPSYYKENTATYKINPNELDEETLGLINRYNCFDIILYNHAKEKFAKVLAEHQQYLEQILPQLKEKNRQKQFTNKWFNKFTIFVKQKITG